jgi:hypothetical protein
MTVRLCTENCCAEDHCIRPARHGELCVAHYMAASPAVRAVCDLLDRVDAQCARAERELAVLEAIWSAPVVVSDVAPAPLAEAA